jgi:tRNA(adenine34) deaminase
MSQDEQLMRMALDEARKAGAAGETPVGAILTDASGHVIAAAGNAPISTNDPTGHAEIRVLRMAAEKLCNYRLPETTLYVTLEPCAMCVGAISFARVKRLVIAASDPKGGAVWHGPRFFEQPTCHWRPSVSEGPFAEESGELLREFFRARR